MTRVGAGIFVIILVIQLVVFSTSEPPLVIIELEWNVKSGDLLSYELYATGTRDELNQGLGFKWSHLNNTRILVNITYLPILSDLYTSEAFLENIVQVTKVSCSFENGTPLSDQDLFIETLVSKSLLPVIPWEYLDSMFPDQWIGEFQMYEPDYTWVSRFDDDLFVFGRLGNSWHFTKGWSALINMTAGIPFKIENHDNYHDYGFTTDILELTLVEYIPN